MKQLLLTRLFGCVPLRWSGSGSVIQDQSDHGRSNEPANTCPEWIHWFIWSTLIRVISDHWSWSRSSERNAPFCELILFNWTLDLWYVKTLIRMAREDSDLCQNKNYTSREHRDFHRLTSYSGHPHMTSIVVDERYLHSNTYHNIFISIPIHRNGIASKLFNYKIIK